MTNADILAQSLAAARSASRISGQKNSYRKDNPGEYAEVIAYLDGGARPTRSLTKMGEHLVLEEDVRRSLVGPPPPPPPPPSTAYFTEDWSSGQFTSAKWVDLYSYSSPGYFSTPRVSTPDGRVSVVNNPAGGGGKCARVEIRDTDPDWASTAGLDKSEIVMSAQNTWNKPTVSFGDVRWYSVQMYFPYVPGGEKFEWAHSGSQNYYSLWGLHTESSQLYSAVILGWEHYQFLSGGDSYQDKNVQLNFHAIGGVFPDNTYSRTINLGLKLTDANGARVMANHNRWVEVVWGIKHNPDNTGWIEAWVDRVNTYPRTNGPTIWSIEDNTAKYFKYGMYRKSDGVFPETGRSVLYYGATSIGTERPF